MTRTESAVMSAQLKLPRGVAELLDQVDVSKRNPGLQLDKLSPPGNQETQLRAIENVCKAARDERLLDALSRRHSATLLASRALRFQATTIGPLTLHLARASGLENAGIHLHPLYGFACLPGSGLKGMARAYAETVWCADQNDPVAAWESIRAVFGWASGSEKGKTWKPEGVGEPREPQAGAVIFHDAWPTAWPRIEPDIVNNHHVKYYDGKDDPGDWEDPVPVYFLSIAAGESFDFAVSPRAAVDGEDLDLVTLASEWLQAALVHEGAGAKTHAGYGRFRLEDRPQPAASAHARRIANHTLRLATPAFLAGAKQERDDCDLRPATLRGLLRWWWRTMHVAHLDRDDLRLVESAIWGDAQQGAALAISIRDNGGGTVKAFNYKDKFRPTLEFAQAHALERPPRNTTQGLFYASYGMDEKGRHRLYVEPGQCWTVTLNARRALLQKGRPAIDAAAVLRQGEAALWLLCRYGGVGSKARKGFGSFADIEVAGIASLEKCKEQAAEFRRAIGLTERSRGAVSSSSLQDMLPSLEVKTPWRDCWFAIDQVGFCAQAFARKNAHLERKAALGLPRQIHGPRNTPMHHQSGDSHKPPQRLSAGGRSRHAAPIHYHLAPRADGTLTVRMTAFPSSGLPDIETSRAVLQEMRNHLQSELEDRARKHAKQGTTRHGRVSPAGPVGGESSVARSRPKPGELVGAVLIEEKTKKGGWKAKHQTSGLQGPIQNTRDVPDDAEPHSQVRLIVASANPREIAFRWPTSHARPPSAGRSRPKPDRGSQQPKKGRR